jgi:hypothetical protein
MRQALKLASQLTGRNLPGGLRREEAIKAQRLADGGDRQAGAWISEHWEVALDWPQLFDDRVILNIAAMGAITDSENTMTKVAGCNSAAKHAADRRF